jgi:hypothetical protein
LSIQSCRGKYSPTPRDKSAHVVWGKERYEKRNEKNRTPKQKQETGKLYRKWKLKESKNDKWERIKAKRSSYKEQISTYHGIYPDDAIDPPVLHPVCDQ